MLLNCDLGENDGASPSALDESVMAHIDQANVACGFHAGDPVSIDATLALAARHGVSVGAHPAYPDRAGFGRRSMSLPRRELIANLHYQVSALAGMAANHGLQLAHIKPHGALYNDMMADADVRSAVLEAVANHHMSMTLIIQATSRWQLHLEEAAAHRVTLSFEAFADRCYTDSGALLPRSAAGAVHGRERMLSQVTQLVQEGTVTTAAGNTIALRADTLCVHGDNPESVQAIAAVRRLLASD